ncbi:glycoside hydrolase family 68 protein [Halobacillus litoralis]|uniref:glycoside hydrolase family 68 protein n=1 Tax=Halobacillus litoralis TaxID=45668 RepID=UPI001CD5C2EB|nr:glycoside hydrolase family 68 protein [Halobacillus litoralis]MCA1020618.1 glycoside hydrolase family 68 protein [Halobacillus litoralis]
MKTNTWMKRSFLVTTALVSTLAFGSSVSAETSQTSNWTIEDASQIERTKDTTAPYIEPDFEKMAPELHVWDTWPLRNKDGSIAKVNGYYVIFSLTAPSDLLPGKRHDVATIRYFYSKDGKSWELGGEAFDPEGAYGSRQWAGSAMIEDGKLNLFYTATGRKGEEGVTYEQRLALAKGDVNASSKGISFENFDHSIILEPEGEHYQTEEQAEQGDIGYTFRDPWFFEDPKTGKDYILFEGNSAGTPVERTLDTNYIGSSSFQNDFSFTDEGFAKLFNGAIGIAEATNDSYTEYEALPPILEANYVNQELERPHIVTKGNQYYLFTNTHEHKFGPDLDAPDGLYGFSSDELTSGYEPLNDSGLVLANPEEHAYQSYSWMVLPNGKVISFYNFHDLDGKNISDLGGTTPEYQMSHFGGTLAPTIKLAIQNDKTKVIKDGHPGKIK